MSVVPIFHSFHIVHRMEHGGARQDVHRILSFAFIIELLYKVTLICHFCKISCVITIVFVLNQFRDGSLSSRLLGSAMKIIIRW